ncbi:MAG: TPMT family class I SAM-dependent methyltransferase [Bacteroidia bacterium]|nr:TPMT family class I SAM-dependent methyltransferase [Bacteroidia bacterium]
MNLPELNADYWDSRWQQSDTGWDIGYPAPAITKFADTLTDKTAKILIPGCGNGYEAEYLHRKGFTNVFIADFSQTALDSFGKRVPGFPSAHLLCADFFELNNGPYDLIIEQTFFCAINPELRDRYVQKMYELLKPEGRLAGLLFNDEMNKDHPPFGGNKAEYLKRFSVHFEILKMDTCADSIPPRAGRELWFELKKKL